MSTDANRFKTLPPLSTHPVDVGRRSEAAVAGELHRRGFEVLLPSTVNTRYDLVVDFGDHFARVQVKTGRLRNGAIRFSTQSTRSNRNGNFRRGYDGEVVATRSSRTCAGRGTTSFLRSRPRLRLMPA